jgi:hypothetical protein
VRSITSCAKITIQSFNEAVMFITEDKDNQLRFPADQCLHTIAPEDSGLRIGGMVKKDQWNPVRMNTTGVSLIT